MRTQSPAGLASFSDRIEPNRADRAEKSVAEGGKIAECFEGLRG